MLRAMDDVQRAYNVDKDRVYLTGLSMGGGGTWHLGLRYPDRFAAIVPVCAVGDLSLFPFTQGASADDRALMDLTGPTVARGERGQPAGLHLPRRRGPRGGRRALAPDGGPVSRARMARQERPLLRAAGRHHFAWDFAYRDASLFARLAPIRATRPRPRRLLDLLAALQPGLLAPDRPDRPRVRAGPHRGDAARAGSSRSRPTTCRRSRSCSTRPWSRRACRSR